MKNEVVDVVIPTFNNSKYLLHAINSVMIQSRYVKKIIVIDDGSTDNTKAIIRPLTQSNKKLHYVYQANAGLSSARNTGIKLSSAKYIAFLDADDIWLPDKLKSQLSKFDTTKYKNLGLVYGEYLDIDEAGKEIRNFGGFRLHKEIKGNVSKQLVECNYATGSGSAVLVKRECFDKVGLFDETLTACEDWDMWMRISKNYSFDYVDAPLVKLRRHQNSMQANRWHMISNRAMLIAKMKKNNIMVHNALFRDIRRELLTVIVSNPFNRKPYRLLKNLSLNMNGSGQYTREYIIDFVWAVYSSLPIIAGISSNKIVRRVVIDPINKYFMKQ